MTKKENTEHCIRAIAGEVVDSRSMHLKNSQGFLHPMYYLQ